MPAYLTLAELAVIGCDLIDLLRAFRRRFEYGSFEVCQRLGVIGMPRNNAFSPKYVDLDDDISVEGAIADRACSGQEGGAGSFFVSWSY